MAGARKTVFRGTTEVEASRSVAQIIQRLVEAGARTVHQEYSEKGVVTALAFSLAIDGVNVPFALPARVEPVFKLLKQQRKHWVNSAMEQKIREQAERVAWRQILAWVEAQFALIQTGMVQPSEVFMPYVRGADGRTLYEYFRANQLALPAPEQQR